MSADFTEEPRGADGPTEATSDAALGLMCEASRFDDRSAGDRRRDYAGSRTEGASDECELERSSLPALRRKRLSIQVVAAHELALRRPPHTSRAAAAAYDRLRHANMCSTRLASHNSASVLSERLDVRPASDVISSIGLDFLRLEGAVHNMPQLSRLGATSGMSAALQSTLIITYHHFSQTLCPINSAQWNTEHYSIVQIELYCTDANYS